MTEYDAGIKAAKAELESYLHACQESDAISRRIGKLKPPGITSGSPTVGCRRGYRMVNIMDARGRPTGKKKRVPSLIPCPISVQTQPNPHREEEYVAEHSYLCFEGREAAKRADEARAKLETRISVLQEPYRGILQAKYVERLTVDDLLISLKLYYSHRQFWRILSKSIELYAFRYGFIKQILE